MSDGTAPTPGWSPARASDGRFPSVLASNDDAGRTPEAAFAEPNPAPAKTMLAHQGLIDAELRPPMTPCSENHRTALLQLFA